MLKDTEILQVPPGAIHLSSVDGFHLKISAFIHFQLTLGDISLPIEGQTFLYLMIPSPAPSEESLTGVQSNCHFKTLNQVTSILS